MLMKWDRTTISASEVNRYTYCPYQWYFERYYGRNKLSQMAKAKKAEPKLKQVKKRRNKKDNLILQEDERIMPKNIKTLKENKKWYG